MVNERVQLLLFDKIEQLYCGMWEINYFSSIPLVKFLILRTKPNKNEPNLMPQSQLDGLK